MLESPVHIDAIHLLSHILLLRVVIACLMFICALSLCVCICAGSYRSRRVWSAEHAARRTRLVGCSVAGLTFT